MGIPLQDQINLAENALRGLSLTKDFARIVMITGHGASTVNNPHATGLDCGACGGHSGEANAKVATTVFNNPAVRKGLLERGIEIPKSTLFIAALHDTTTDEVTIFNKYLIPDSYKSDLKSLERWLDRASKTTRIERSPRMNVAVDTEVYDHVAERSIDWSQVRPEWGLAGCSAFIVAPREDTIDLNLEGKSFLHTYKWQEDEDFKVLETIMTSPMVVTSRINLQY